MTWNETISSVFDKLLLFIYFFSRVHFLGFDYDLVLYACELVFTSLHVFYV